MFNSLAGTITVKTHERLCLETGGVEWDIAISRPTAAQLPEAGNRGKVYTYLYHREDRMLLYGFATEDERTLFFDLNKVESIGPSLAMKILSGMPASEFVQALEAENVALLTTIPGLGKKTAEKIIFKLRGKLTAAPHEAAGHQELVLALTGMGFDVRRAQEALAAALRDVEREGKSAAEVERELLHLALKKLGTGG